MKNKTFLVLVVFNRHSRIILLWFIVECEMKTIVTKNLNKNNRSKQCCWKNLRVCRVCTSEYNNCVIGIALTQYFDYCVIFAWAKQLWHASRFLYFYPSDAKNNRYYLIRKIDCYYNNMKTLVQCEFKRSFWYTSLAIVTRSVNWILPMLTGGRSQKFLSRGGQNIFVI